MKWGVFWLLLSILNSTGFAQSELVFPLEKNNIQVLPLRFEYQLVDKDHFKLGDILLDAEQLKFELAKIDPKGRRYKAIFHWPASLIQKGEVAIKDPGGKAIWSLPFTDKNIKLEKQEDPQIRNSLASMELSVNLDELLKKLRFFAFFKLCVHREEEFTKSYLCSKDLYIKNNKGQLSVESRDSLRPDSYVEINGTVVGNQGVIFLNDPKESLSLRTLLLSGASFEIETRLKKVDFSDVTLSEDESKLIVRASGAEPVREDLVQRLDKNNWTVELQPDRPFLYLRAEGDIPMRQEFIITGKVRKDSLRVKIISASPQKTFANEISILVEPNQKAQVLPADKKGSVQKKGESQYLWKMESLDSMRTNRRFLSVQTEGGNFIAAYDIFRQPAYEFQLSLAFPVWAHLLARRFLTEKWDLQLAYDLLAVKAKNDPSINATKLGGGYSFGETNLSRLGLAYQMMTLDTEKLAGFEISLRHHRPQKIWFYDQHELELLLPLGIKSSNLSMSSSYEISYSLVSELNPYWRFDTRLQYRNWKFTGSSTDYSYSRSMLALGLRTVF